MIDYPSIRKAILTGLRDHLRKTWHGIIVIMANPDAPEPPEQPYLTMNVLTPFIPSAGMPSRTWVAGVNGAVILTQHTEGYMTCSFTVYAGGGHDLARLIGLQAHEYFSFYGYDALSRRGVVVAELMPLQNRDAYDIDTLSRRVGFDVKLRVGGKSVMEFGSIETADISIETTGS